ncbi:MAG: ferredoxin:thioredoxin reductase [Candidatus Heimdallarchaeota archaeon]|nr:ferredoxin:thioredoxin reductase [Candidatus Heimdallarchaeota archaeon]
MTSPKREKTKEDVRYFIEMVAKKNGWILNNDKKFIEMLVEGFQSNYNRYGYFGCPCRLLDGIREKDKDILCPCDYCIPDQKEFGHCYCGLYLTPEFSKTGKKTDGIPERRPEEKWF